MSISTRVCWNLYVRCEMMKPLRTLKRWPSCLWRITVTGQNISGQGRENGILKKQTRELLCHQDRSSSQRHLFSILDSLTTELMKRKEVCCKLQNKFGFLFHITTLSEGSCFQFAATFLYRCGARICRRVHSVLWIHEASPSRNVFTPSYYESYSKCWDL